MLPYTLEWILQAGLNYRSWDEIILDYVDMPNTITRVILEGGKRLKMKEGNVIELVA